MALKILTADDSASIRQMVAFSLEQGSYETVTASDGQDAFEKLQQTPVDMLISDLDMPRMDGIQLTRKVRGLPQYRRVPILILTTESDSTIKTRAKAAGATGWITKPFTPKQLIAVVDKILRP
jgi:two-component system chemotaxis response regulator CheY